MKYALKVMALTLLFPVLAGGQDASIAPGTRVRITAANLGLEKHVATVVETRGDSPVVARKGRPRAIERRDIPDLGG